MTSDDDKARFARVVLPHLGDAYALARWITGNRTDAEDVVQDACLRAFRAIGAFGGNSARAWTLRIVRNAAYTLMSRRRATPLVAVGGLDDIAHAESLDVWDRGGMPTPEAEVIAKADAVRLEAAIAALPPPFRETLVLRDLQELEYREIAEVTGVPIGTVMSRLARARRRLIDAIGAER